MLNNALALSAGKSPSLPWLKNELIMYPRGKPRFRGTSTGFEIIALARG